MKKNNISILILILGMSFQLKAQTISLGPAASFGHSFISSDNVESKFHPSFAAGLSLTYSNVEHSGFGADLLYSLEGSTSELNIAGLMIENEVNLSYLRLPIRVIYFWGDFGDPVRPKVFVGPTLGFLMAAETGSIDIKDQYNSFDLGLHGGLGANFQLGERAWLNTDITYTQGLTDITKSELSEEVNRNGNLRLNVGLLFGLGN